MIQSLFEEKVRGNVPEHVFKRMIGTYDTEQTGLRDAVSQLERELDEKKSDPRAIKKWIDRIKGYVGLKTLDRETVMTLIDHITVSERFEKRGIKQQNIENHIIHLQRHFVHRKGCIAPCGMKTA